MEGRIYAAIDLKSFYASVECVERGLDPLNTNLVVADPERTEKTVCLAVSPSLKSYGLSGRARLFEVVSKVKAVNAKRRSAIKGKNFRGASYIATELDSSPYLKLDYITAPPRMALYIKYSRKIYETYLKYISSDDIHVYSIDEVFIDLTPYLKTYKLTGKELTVKIILDVYKTTGITATAGIGTNLYLAKVGMDILAKRQAPDRNGVRIAELDEYIYRRELWSHRPLTDFWRVGHGYSEKLMKLGIYTMGDIAKLSLRCESVLYKLFGVNAELLIDHAWGWEPTTIKDIKAYRPERTSITTGQVLQCPYSFEKCKIVIMEMCDALALDLVERGLFTKQIVLSVGYDTENLKNGREYSGEIKNDRYGRHVPSHVHGTVNFESRTSSSREITGGVISLFESLADKNMTYRRINITAADVLPDSPENDVPAARQIDIFSLESEEGEKICCRKKEKDVQKAMIKIKQKYGKNSILKGLSMQEGATSIERNGQIGGHKA